MNTCNALVDMAIAVDKFSDLPDDFVWLLLFESLRCRIEAFQPSGLGNARWLRPDGTEFSFEFMMIMPMVDITALLPFAGALYELRSLFRVSGNDDLYYIGHLKYNGQRHMEWVLRRYSGIDLAF